MRFFWKLFYNLIFIPLLFIAYHIYALFNEKAGIGLRSRKAIFDKMKPVPNTNDKPYLIWFHCSSVGEFEQARPIVEAIKDRARVVISFFSPSGYNLASKYPYADLLCYLPFDTIRNARRMFRLICPSMLVFIRFDIWPNYVWTASRLGVPVMLVDAALHEESSRLYPIVRNFLKSVHRYISVHCAISEADAQRLRRICLKNSVIRVVGDTRFDQVIARKKSAVRKLGGLLPKFDSPVIIAGSTYAEDEEVVLEAYKKVLSDWGKAQLILVPHEPEVQRLEEIESLMSYKGLPHIRLANIEKYNGEAIIVDRVGVLAELYMLGDITFIGGSFHGSVHNVMEPAIMGKPVIFGPDIQNSLEAHMLIERGAGITINDSEELAKELVRLLSDNELRARIGESARAMVEENAGATDKIVDCIDEFLHSIKD